MAIEVQAVVSRTAKEPARVETMTVDDPGPGEVLVRIQASGICHTDLLYRDGDVGDEFPYLLGHEGAGIVEAVGPGVQSPKVGEYVILAWRAPCGTCRFCLIGQPHLCSASLNAEKRMRTADGKTLTPALGIGSFCTHTVVAASQAVPVPREVPPEEACLIGCGVMTGVGAAFYTAPVRAGSTVAVFGCGTVGASAIMGSSLRNAARIIAVDIAPRKLAVMSTFGATDTVDARDGEVVERILDLTDGHGVDYSFECAGLTQTLEQALWCRDLAGICTMIGVPSPTARYELPTQQFFGRGGSLRVSWYGDCLPSRDFPLLCDLYLKGKLKLDELVNNRVPLGDAEMGFEAMHDGETLKSVINLER
jgi:S-(hydroxymethyl)mycothiol dehydrogenase